MCQIRALYSILASIDKDITSFICGEHVYSLFLPVKVEAWKIQNTFTVGVSWAGSEEQPGMHTVYILVNRVQAVHSTALVLFENCQKLIVGNAQEWIWNVLVYLH